MWSAEIKDPNAPLTLTKSDFDQAMSLQQDSIKIAAANDIEKVVSNAAKDGNGGSIDLLRQGEYDTKTGTYSSEKPSVQGTLSIISTGGEGGKNVAIQFQADGSKPFTVDAGSKVEASKVSNGKVTQLKINGNPYDIGGGSSVTSGYVTSEGDVYIKQDGDAPDSKGILLGRIKVTGTNGINVTPNLIEGNKGLEYVVSGAGLADTSLSNLTEAGKTEIKSLEKHIKPGNYTIGANGDVTMTYVDGNNEDVEGQAIIKGVASQTYVDGKDALNVKYDSAEKTSVTLGGEGSQTPVKLTNVADGSTKYDAVNFGQLQTVANAEDYVTGGSIDNNSGTITLNRQLGGSVEVTGLKTYLTANDDYATGATLNGSKLTVQRHLGGSFDVDLSGLTSGLSSSDYQLVADPSGEYKVSADGKLTLKVQDMNNPEAQPEDVAISGIAQKDYVDGQFTTINTNLTEMNTAIDSHDQKLKHIEHYDGGLFTPDYTTVEGTEFYNDGSISSKVDSILQDATNSFNFNDNGGSFVTKKESGIGGPFVGGTKTTTTDKAEFNDGGATFTNTTKTEEYKFGHLFPDVTETTSSTNIKGGTITLTSSAREDGTPIEINGTTGDVTGLSNTEWDATKTYSDGRAATEEQLQKAIEQAGTSAAAHDYKLVQKADGTPYTIDDNDQIKLKVASEEDSIGYEVTIDDVAKASDLEDVKTTAEKGWTATGETGSVDVKPGNTLKFVGDGNTYTSAGNGQIKVGLRDNITLGDENGKYVFIGGSTGTIKATDSITVGIAGTTNVVTINSQYITGLANTTWAPAEARDEETTYTKNQAATQGQLDDLYSSVVGYDLNPDGTINYSSITLKGTPYSYNEGNPTNSGGTRITNVAYSDGTGSDAVNVDYLNNAIETATTGEGGVIAENEKHLATNAGVNPDNKDNYYKPDEDGNITINEVNGNGVETGNSVVINDVASKEQLDKVSDQVDKNTTNIGDMDFSDTNYIKGDTNLTDAVVDLDGAIKDTNDRIDGLGDKIDEVSNSSITGGKINEDTGKIDLIKNDGTAVTMEGQLLDSILDTVDDSKLKSDGEIILTSHDKYDPNKTESVTLNDIASKTNLDNLSSTVGATTTEELKESYKDTAYINDADTMVDADVKLDQAVQNVASTSYANDMYLNERINNVESRLGDVEERIDKVGAMAAAIANLRTMGYDPEAPTEIAVGVGQYKSETGLALGIFHYPNQDFMLSASISTSGDEVMGGIGATWKLGRKSAEERAKDEEERILAKAEEIKQAAKRAEVKAQADRHAQLLAEREAAGEPIRPVEEA